MPIWPACVSMCCWLTGCPLMERPVGLEKGPWAEESHWEGAGGALRPTNGEWARDVANVFAPENGGRSPLWLSGEPYSGELSVPKLLGSEAVCMRWCGVHGLDQLDIAKIVGLEPWWPVSVCKHLASSPELSSQGLRRRLREVDLARRPRRCELDSRREEAKALGGSMASGRGCPLG